MATLYQTVKVLHDYHYSRLNSGEKRFITSMWQALQGIGDNPSNATVEDQCALSPRQIHFIWTIAKRFLISKDSKIN